MQMYGCPMHQGVGDKGLIESLAYLKEHYSNLDFPLLPELFREEEHLPNLKNLNGVIATCDSIASYAYNILKSGEMPLFIAGDHSSAMGSVSASSTYHWEMNQKETGLIWIDAHPDINDENGTVTGNIHGMPVNALLGKCTDKLTRFLSDRTKLQPENVVMFGLRDIDPPEQVILDELNIRYYTYDMICEKGLSTCLQEVTEYLSHLSAVHISFDIDSMDPEIMPGVSVPAPGGFTIPDVMQIFETLFPSLPVIACDIVEYNHVHDKDDVTAKFVSSLVEKLHTL